MSLAFPFCICSILQTLLKFKSFASLNYDYHRNTRRSQPFCIAFHFLFLLQRPGSVKNYLFFCFKIF